MSDIYWNGTAPAVAQVENHTIDVFDVTSTYKLTIGDVTVEQIGLVDQETTAAALNVKLDAETHVYFTAIDWTIASAIITATASFAGVPFVIVPSVDGGTGTITQSGGTVNSGPNDWNTADNWSGNVVPVNSDDVIIENSSNSIRWGLDQSAVTLTSLIIKKSFAGKIGLKEKVFAQSSNGETVTNADVEYRDSYLNIKATDVQIGENLSNASQTGSGLIKLDLDSVASTITVFDSASAAETNKPAIQLLANNSSTQIFVREAKGGVGVAVGQPFETSTISRVDIGDSMTQSGVTLGAGVNITTWTQKSGTNFIEAATTITTVSCLGGTLKTEGDFTITTANVGDSGVLLTNNIKTAGVAITTLNIESLGEVDTLESSEARTFTTVNLSRDSVIKADRSILTITTLNEPSGAYEITVS